MYYQFFIFDGSNGFADTRRLQKYLQFINQGVRIVFFSYGSIHILKLIVIKQQLVVGICFLFYGCFNILILLLRSTPCPNVKHGDDWGDPTQCENGDNCGYCHTRTEQQFHPEVCYIYKLGFTAINSTNFSLENRLEKLSVQLCKTVQNILKC